MARATQKKSDEPEKTAEGKYKLDDLPISDQEWLLQQAKDQIRGEILEEVRQKAKPEARKEIFETEVEKRIARTIGWLNDLAPALGNIGGEIMGHLTKKPEDAQDFITEHPGVLTLTASGHVVWGFLIAAITESLCGKEFRPQSIKGQGFTGWYPYQRKVIKSVSDPRSHLADAIAREPGS